MRASAFAAEPEKWIRAAAREGRVWWSRHATQKLSQRGLKRRKVENSIESADVIEYYDRAGRPHPGALALASLADGSPLHVVVAADEAAERLYVVTVYRPEKERWHDDWKTRKIR